MAGDRQPVRRAGASDPILLVPAIRPDVALFHAARADRAGNVWIGVRRELMLMAHAARTTLVTVEEIVEDDLLADDRSAAGTIPALYVSAIAEARARRLAGRPARRLSARSRASAPLCRGGARPGRASGAISTASCASACRRNERLAAARSC